MHGAWTHVLIKSYSILSSCPKTLWLVWLSCFHLIKFHFLLRTSRKSAMGHIQDMGTPCLHMEITTAVPIIIWIRAQTTTVHRIICSSGQVGTQATHLIATVTAVIIIIWAGAVDPTHLHPVTTHQTTCSITTTATATICLRLGLAATRWATTTWITQAEICSIAATPSIIIIQILLTITIPAILIIVIIVTHLITITITAVAIIYSIITTEILTTCSTTTIATTIIHSTITGQIPTISSITTITIMEVILSITTTIITITIPIIYSITTIDPIISLTITITLIPTTTGTRILLLSIPCFKCWTLWRNSIKLYKSPRVTPTRMYSLQHKLNHQHPCWTTTQMIRNMQRHLKLWRRNTRNGFGIPLIQMITHFTIKISTARRKKRKHSSSSIIRITTAIVWKAMWRTIRTEVTLMSQGKVPIEIEMSVGTMTQYQLASIRISIPKRPDWAKWWITHMSHLLLQIHMGISLISVNSKGSIIVIWYLIEISSAPELMNQDLREPNLIMNLKLILVKISKAATWSIMVRHCLSFLKAWGTSIK